MNNKRGQFYIVAAVIIVVILSGLASVATYTIIKSQPKTLYDLSSDLKKESYNLIDYGVYNGKDAGNLLNNFMDEKFGPYYLKKTDSSEIVFIYGNNSDVKGLMYKSRNSGKISLGSSDWETYGIFSEKKKPEVINGKINVKVLDKNYEFNLKENEVFYFIMIQEKEGETYIEKN